MTQVGSFVSRDEYLRVIRENDELKQKYDRIQRENDELKQEIAILKAGKGIISLMNKLIYVD